MRQAGWGQTSFLRQHKPLPDWGKDKWGLSLASFVCTLAKDIVLKTFFFFETVSTFVTALVETGHIFNLQTAFFPS